MTTAAPTVTPTVRDTAAAPKPAPKSAPKSPKPAPKSAALVSLFTSAVAARDAATRALRIGATDAPALAARATAALATLGAASSVCLTRDDAALLDLPMRGTTGPNGPALVAALCGDRIKSAPLRAFLRAHKSA